MSHNNYIHSEDVRASNW